MPVTFDNIATFVHSGTSATIPLTVGSKAVLLVYAGGVGSFFSVSTMEFAGAPLTFLGFVGNGTRFEVWGLTAPAAGVGTLSAVMANDIDAWHFVAVTYQHVKAIGPFGGVASATATSATNFNFSISCTTTDLVCTCLRSQSNTTSNNGTLRGSAVSSFVHQTLIDISGAAGSVTVSATESVASFWAALAVPLHFSAATASSPLFSLATCGCGR